jgi:tetratricopeptide (TPR) repeat protein
MKMKTFLIWLALSLHCGYSTAQFFEDDFEIATEAFNNGNYQYALDLFQLLQAEGDDSPAIQYNIAVCLYRLERYPESQDGFRDLLLDEFYQWLAQYNLGLIALKLNNTDIALDYFKQVAELSNDTDLSVLALEQYTANGGEGLGHIQQKSSSRWHGSLSAGLGYDNNVIDQTDFSNTAESDNYFETLGSLSRRWGDTQNGLDLDVVGYLTEYNDVDEYNIGLVNIGLSKLFGLGDFRFAAGGGFSYLQLGGEDYLQDWSLKLSVSHPLWNDKNSLKLNYEYSMINALAPEFEPQDGERHLFALEYINNINSNWRWHVRYRFQDDDRSDNETFFSFTSFSAERHEINSRLIWEKEKWDVVFDASYRDSRFRDENRLFTGEIIRREDELKRVSGTGSYHLSDNWSLALEIRYADNKSSIDLYQYDQLNIAASINFIF